MKIKTDDCSIYGTHYLVKRDIDEKKTSYCGIIFNRWGGVNVHEKPSFLWFVGINFVGINFVGGKSEIILISINQMFVHLYTFVRMLIRSQGLPTKVTNISPPRTN